jgi:carboxypeptidase C (cathepsin A)
MSQGKIHWPLFALLAAGLSSGALAPVAAQEASRGGAPATDGAPAARNGRGGAGTETARPEQLPPLPADRSSHHRITLAGGRLLDFTATAGTTRLFNAGTGAPLADVATLAFRLDNSPARTRPVTFVFNGGPGYASGWMNLGGLGPWRLDMNAAAQAPSAPPVLSDNAESWLDFTDLVFIDPPGTGYSRILGGDDIRKNLWSVGGDIDAAATVIRRWTEQNDRLLSPKFIAGESYGGFRAPKISAKLQTEQGIGVSGLILISPVLDFGRFNATFSPLSYVARLPSQVAVTREAKGPVTRDQLADVEAYAKSDFLADLMRGVRDPGVLDRLSTRVAELTGLDGAFVRRLGGRISANTYLREHYRKVGLVGSSYDGTVTGFDPNPFSERSGAEDQLRVGLHAPIIQAMVDLYRNRLGWVVENGRYQFFNEQASRQWDWGRGDSEAVGDLRQDLALDPHMRVLVAHGLTDLVTPYFETQMVLDQIPTYGDGNRLNLKIYPGGHMIYIRDESRKALAADARKLIEGQ